MVFLSSVRLLEGGLSFMAAPLVLGSHFTPSVTLSALGKEWLPLLLVSGGLNTLYWFHQPSNTSVSSPSLDPFHLTHWGANVSHQDPE